LSTKTQKEKKNESSKIKTQESELARTQASTKFRNSNLGVSTRNPKRKKMNAQVPKAREKQKKSSKF
jgi:hypothetical protein